MSSVNKLLLVVFALMAIAIIGELVYYSTLNRTPKLSTQPVNQQTAEKSSLKTQQATGTPVFSLTRYNPARPGDYDMVISDINTKVYKTKIKEIKNETGAKNGYDYVLRVSVVTGEQKSPTNYFFSQADLKILKVYDRSKNPISVSDLQQNEDVEVKEVIDQKKFYLGNPFTAKLAVEITKL